MSAVELAYMSNKGLQAARKLLMLEVNEAAELVGQVSPRTWRHWEAGHMAVPLDVRLEMELLLEVRMYQIDCISDFIDHQSDPMTLPFHTSFQAYSLANPGKTKLEWRIAQSVAATYYTEGLVELV